MFTLSSKSVRLGLRIHFWTLGRAGPGGEFRYHYVSLNEVWPPPGFIFFLAHRNQQQRPGLRDCLR